MNFNLKDMINLEDTRGKIIFWDIDGTLAAYRFNGHVGEPGGTNNGMSIEEINNGVFLYRHPSKFMQKIVNECEAKEQIIMGHSAIQKEIDDKHIWLDTHYPIIKKRLLIFENHSKADTIVQYCMKNNIELKDVIYVDDVIAFIREAERKGITSYHISSFLDWGMNK